MKNIHKLLLIFSSLILSHGISLLSMEHKKYHKPVKIAGRVSPIPGKIDKKEFFPAKKVSHKHGKIKFPITIEFPVKDVWKKESHKPVKHAKKAESGEEFKREKELKEERKKES